MGLFRSLTGWNQRRSYQGRHHKRPNRNQIGSHRSSVQDLLGIRGQLVGRTRSGSKVRRGGGLWYNDNWAGGFQTIKPQRFPTATYGTPRFGGMFRDFT